MHGRQIKRAKTNAIVNFALVRNHPTVNSQVKLVFPLESDFTFRPKNLLTN